jgi:hypothetical protein
LCKHEALSTEALKKHQDTFCKREPVHWEASLDRYCKEVDELTDKFLQQIELDEAIQMSIQDNFKEFEEKKKNKQSSSNGQRVCLLGSWDDECDTSRDSDSEHEARLARDGNTSDDNDSASCTPGTGNLAV